jgi:hypothetical protein
MVNGSDCFDFVRTSLCIGGISGLEHVHTKKSF